MPLDELDPAGLARPDGVQLAGHGQQGGPGQHQGDGAAAAPGRWRGEGGEAGATVGLSNRAGGTAGQASSGTHAFAEGIRLGRLFSVFVPRADQPPGQEQWRRQ